MKSFSQYRFLDRLSLGVLHDYNQLRADSQVKNIAAWAPVVAEILEGINKFDDKAVSADSVKLVSILTFVLVQEIYVRGLSSRNRDVISGTRS